MFLQLRIDNEDWKLQFIQGLKDIHELRESETDEQKTKSISSLKSLIGTIYQKGKVTNDWKNIIGLPSDLSEKIDMLAELGSKVWGEFNLHI